MDQKSTDTSNEKEIVENTMPQEEETEWDTSTEEESVLDGEAETAIAVVQNEIVDESRLNPFSNLCRK